MAKANLHMNIMADPGIDKMTFELSSLAVSALNACGMCINAHATQLEKHGVTKEAVQSTVRIDSVLNGGDGLNFIYQKLEAQMRH